MAAELAIEEISLVGEAKAIAEGDYTGAALAAIPVVGGAFKKKSEMVQKRKKCYGSCEKIC